jgi:2-amino-4-hydroxy-6-hydroxymethyldihydropteridine diphosphokinase
MMVEVGFGIGSNLGDKQATIERTLENLFAGPDISFRAASSFYRTEPWGHADQDWFLNVCAVGETELPAWTVLRRCRDLERALGREDTFRWGPRVIDIDILWYDDEVRSEPGLTLPHKELFNRAFVLVPLAEVRPDLELGGRRVNEAAATSDQASVQPVAPPWVPERI